MHSTLFSFLLLVLINVGVVSGATINREISTVLDLTTSYVRLSADVKVSGADGAYVLSFPTSWGTHLSYLSAKVNEREMTIEALAPRSV